MLDFQIAISRILLRLKYPCTADCEFRKIATSVHEYFKRKGILEIRCVGRESGLRWIVGANPWNKLSPSLYHFKVSRRQASKASRT